MAEISRRTFLAGAAGAAALGAVGCSTSTPSGQSGSATTAAARPPGTQVLPDPANAPFDTVVIVMMENRSFDHLLGWLPGANGKQAGLSYVDSEGKTWPTWEIAPDFQGCKYQDPFHLWQSMQTHYDDGNNDGFLKTQPVGDQFPISYYQQGDLPVLMELAQNYTTFDNYFCSMLGPTWPNRLYQLSATTDLLITGFYPAEGQPRPVNLELAIFDRLQEAGLTSTYYTNGEPMTGLYASKKYDSLTVDYTNFAADAKAGKLSNVVFIDPDYTAASEFSGTSNDYHPYGDLRLAEAFMAEVHDTLASSPQWDRMVAFVNFDENGGFYDHVPPPAAQDDTVIAGPGPFPDLKRLGFRVPAIAIGPYAPTKIEQSGPYEHCSILKLIEWRWNLQPMTRRDQTANNIAVALDFSTKREPYKLAPFTAPPKTPCPPDSKHLP